MIKSKFKRVTSLFLATLMCVTTFAGIGSTTAYAASGEKADVYMVDFPRDGDANYDGVWGHSNLTLKNGWHTGRSNFTNLKAIGSYSGNVAYCIEPGISLKVGQTMNKYDENYFNNLAANGVISGDEIRLFVGRILQYGYRGTISTSWRSQNEAAANSIAQAYATQLLIWETVIGERDANFNHVAASGCSNVKDVINGKHLWGEEKAWFKFRKVADRICEKYGLYYDPNPNRSKQSDYLTMKEKAGMPTRYSVAKEAIDYAIDHSKTLKEFQFALKEMGYAYNLSPSRKYWTVIPKGYDKPIRLKNLGADYTNDRIVERIKENRDRWAEIEPFQRATYKPRQYRMQTRGQKLKKKGGLYGLYLYYCYRLGYLPKYKKQNNARLHYLLKDDLMKLDKITDEVRLLGRENISTDEQLFSYKTSLEEQMKNLIAGRTHLRKKIRTNIDDGQLQAAKDEIASINGELKKLRREVKLCEDIAERSKVMEENLEHIETEEQKQQRKEKSRYEQRW